MDVGSSERWICDWSLDFIMICVSFIKQADITSSNLAEKWTREESMVMVYVGINVG